jgi:hypothetical protein
MYADRQLTKHNFGAQFNGIGCISDVLANRSLAPMQYRVLVPWICGLFGAGEKSLPYLRPYIWLRWLSIPFAIGAAHLYFSQIQGPPPVLCTALLALFFVAAALYDYTDGYLEIGFFALAFLVMGQQGIGWILLLAVVSLLAVLNRETAVFIPVVCFLDSFFMAGIVSLVACAAGYAIPRMIYGKHDRYCRFWLVGENIREMTRHYRTRPWVYVEYTLFWALLAVMAAVYVGAFPEYTAVELAMALLFLGLLIPTKWREIRVFGPCTLALIPMVTR